MAQVDVRVEVAGRTYSVTCEEGQQKRLRAAAKLLDTEAKAFSTGKGRAPREMVLLMAGLVLTDKLSADLSRAEGELAKANAGIEGSTGADGPSAANHDGRLLEITERAEGIADRAEAGSE